MIDAAIGARFSVACLAIAVVLGAFWYVGRSLRRGGDGGRGRTLALRESVFLPNGASLHLIRVGTRTFVIGRAGGTLSTICELPADAPTVVAGPTGAVCEPSDRCAFS